MATASIDRCGLGHQNGRMSQPQKPRFDAHEQAILDGIDKHLHRLGWSETITIDRLLQQWQEFAATVDRYDATIYEYGNDLCIRDALEIALGQCPKSLRAKLMRLIEPDDREFFDRTRADTHRLVGHYLRIDASSGWWWHRVPAASPHSDFLEFPAQERN
jgi:hypothetical protein